MKFVVVLVIWCCLREVGSHCPKIILQVWQKFSFLLATGDIFRQICPPPANEGWTWWEYFSLTILAKARAQLFFVGKIQSLQDIFAHFACNFTPPRFYSELPLYLTLWIRLCPREHSWRAIFFIFNPYIFMIYMFFFIFFTWLS